ncbi:hypothetical protein BX666DRAFT_1948104 [Dichotomocladium elegans]|nr:hypothetical protein BX666DRAFT_1948104 [Dichotomocladium elegans]
MWGKLFVRASTFAIRTRIMANPRTGITIYHNPSCSKCRNSTKFLEENQEKGHYKLNIVKYKVDPPTRDELEQLVTFLGLRDGHDGTKPWQKERPWDYLLRPEAQKKVGSFEEAFDLIEKDPALLERPFVIDWDRKLAALGRPDMSQIEQIVEGRV